MERVVLFDRDRPTGYSGAIPAGGYISGSEKTRESNGQMIDHPGDTFETATRGDTTMAQLAGLGVRTSKMTD